MLKKDKKKEKKEEIVEEAVVEAPDTRKAEYLALYDKLKELGITRISDLENKIANCK